MNTGRLRLTWPLQLTLAWLCATSACNIDHRFKAPEPSDRPIAPQPATGDQLPIIPPDGSGALAGRTDLQNGAGSSSPHTIVGTAPSPMGAATSPAGHVRTAVLGDPLRQAKVVRRVPPNTLIELGIGLHLDDAEGLAAAARAVSDPYSQQFRRYLSVQEFGERFGVSKTTYQTLLDWAKSNGLTALAHPNRFFAEVSGRADDVERALHVKLSYGLRLDGTEFYMPDSEPTLDLAVDVEDISHLENYSPPKAGYCKQLQGTGTGTCAYRSGWDYRNAYARCGNTTTVMTGAGQRLGILMFDGFLQSDITMYAASMGISPLSVLLNPSNGFVPGGHVEGTLDLEMALSMAPDVQLVAFWGSSQNTILSHMAADTTTKQFSSSWFSTSNTSTTYNLITELATQGQTLFWFSGDNGAYAAGNGPASTLDPREHPDVTVVGATALTLNQGGYWLSEEPWFYPAGTGNTSTSGGVLTNPGTNHPAMIPSYQVNVNPQNHEVSTRYRNLPDVSAEGAANVIVLNGQVDVSGGTSAASPLWAGFAALVNQYAAQSSLPSVGALNPALYAAAASSNFGTTFNDVTTGANPSYVAAEQITLTGNTRALNATTINGIGTRFTSELAVGDVVMLSGTGYVIAFVSAIADDTHMTVAPYMWSYGLGDGTLQTIIRPVQFHSTPGYDLATGLGSPHCGLMNALTTMYYAPPPQPTTVYGSEDLTSRLNVPGYGSGYYSPVSSFISSPAYHGGGEELGKDAMLAGTQATALMSRPLDYAEECTPGTSTRPEGLLYGLDGVTVVRSSANMDASWPCNSVTTNLAMLVTERNGIAGLQCPGCQGSGNNVYAFQDSKDVLRVLYTGMDHTAGADLSKQDCNSDLRHALADQRQLFFGSCSNESCGAIRHAFRPGDTSGATDQFLKQLGLPSIVTAPAFAPGSTVTPFCNGADMQDEDPIRRDCAESNPDGDEQICNSVARNLLGQTNNMVYGSTSEKGWHGGPTTNPADSNSADLGLVLPIVIPEFTLADDSSAFPYNDPTPCSPISFGGSFRYVPMPVGSISASQSKCPDGNARVGGQCQWPARKVGSSFFFGCVNKKNNVPGARNISNMDGRVYNLIARNPDGSIKTFERMVNGIMRRLPIHHAFYRLHETAVMNDPATAGLSGCMELDAITQIGCLVKASPCSIGFASRGAATLVPGTASLAINGLQPDDASIRLLLTAPGSSSQYPLAYPLYLNSIVGFDSINPYESDAALPGWLATRPTADAFVDFVGAVKLDDTGSAQVQDNRTMCP